MSKKKEKIHRQVYDLIDEIPILSYMASLDRPHADMIPRDDKGRIKVDVTRPHILKDMDYFRAAALHFQEHGCYTRLMPNPHPRSDYMRYWLEEMRRCKEGYVRKKDGEWISGYYYWYLNYCPIMKTVTIEDHSDSDLKRAERIFTFPDVWDSDYLYFHYLEQAEQRGLHAVVLKTRGRGFSYKGGGLMDRNYYHIPQSKSYALASEGEYLKGDAILDKAWDVMDFVDEHTPWKKARDEKDTAMHRRASYKDPKSKVVKGYKSEIIGVTLKNQPERARGKRGKVILFEEAGKFPHLLKAWSIARPSVEQGNVTFGTMVAFGTGGTEGADFEGIRTLFSQPEGYRIYSIQNVFDQNAPEDSKSGWYCGEYFNREGHYDKDGNSDVFNALIEIIEEREKVKKATTDPNAMIQEKADRSITPLEAMMRREGSLFPVEDLKVQRSEVEAHPARWTDKIFNVDLVNRNGQIELKPSDHYPIKEFPVRDNFGLHGCVEIFEHPPEDEVPSNMYIAGVDPYDDDVSTTASLGSCIVMHRITGRIVAEYTGRPATAEKFYEICYRLIRYYNAKCNYENNKKGMFSYFEKRNALYLLADTPKILKDMQIMKTSTFGNTAKGTNATKNVNAWARSLIKSWLLDTAYSEEEGQDHDRLNLHTIWNTAMLKELEMYNPNYGNYDRISAFGMVLILKEDLFKLEVVDEPRNYPSFFDNRPSNRANRHRREPKQLFSGYTPVHRRPKSN